MAVDCTIHHDIYCCYCILLLISPLPYYPASCQHMLPPFVIASTCMWPLVAIIKILTTQPSKNAWVPKVLSGWKSPEVRSKYFCNSRFHSAVKWMAKYKDPSLHLTKNINPNRTDCFCHKTWTHQFIFIGHKCPWGPWGPIYGSWCI